MTGTPLASGRSNIVISAANSSGTGTATLVLSILPSTPAQVVVYPGPGTNAYRSSLYTVQVSKGTVWTSSYVYAYSRSSVQPDWHNGASPTMHFTTFSTTGPVNIQVSKTNNGAITSVSINPLSKSIPYVIINGQAILTLSQNDKIWLTINGDDTNPLFIFADPPKPAVPSGATYFGPGVTNISTSANTNHYQAKNNEVIYLDGGAWVRGNINIIGTTNVTIMGPGVLSGDLWKSENINPLSFNQFLAYCMIEGDSSSPNGSSCTVQGITIVDSPGYNIRYVNTASGVKLISPWYYSTDGFYAMHTDECFAFVGDNALFTLWYLGGSENVTITHTFAGCDNNLLICGGYWGFPTNIAWSVLVDSLDVKTYGPGVFQVWVDNTNSTYGFRNHTYQNVHVDGSLANGPLMELENYVYPWGSPNPNPPLGSCYNFSFKNVTLQGTQTQISQLCGNDATDEFHNVTFQDLQINGTLVTATNVSTYININSYVTGVGFSTASNKTISASTYVGGFISPRGSVPVGTGTNQTFVITPAAGCMVSNVVVDGVSKGAITSYTFTNIAANHTITASFSIAPTPTSIFIW